jgi:hypothetical protein
MKFEIPNLRQGPKQPNVFDGRGQNYFVGGGGKVSELVFGLPMVKGEELAVLSGGELAVLIRRSSAAGGSSGTPYTSSTSIAAITGLAAEEQLKLARIGARLEDLIIDDKAAAKDTAHQDLYWKSVTAATMVLRQLDIQLATGNGSAPNMRGLESLPALFTGRTAAEGSAAAFESDVRKAIAAVTTNGRGPGEGTHCLIGNDRVLRRFMAVTGGQNGKSGFAHDARSGLNVFHYMGIPFYRTAIATTGGSGVEKTKLYAANLGPTGLNLLYAYGTPANFGLALDDASAPTGQVVKDMVVHGAWALACWEGEAFFEITNVFVEDAVL